MARQDRYHGGLIFSSDADDTFERFCRIAAATLEDHGYPVDRQSVGNSHAASVVSSQYLVTLSLDDGYDDEDVDYSAFDPGLGDTATMVNLFQPDKRLRRLVISLCPVAPGRDDPDISELMLVVMLYRMVDICYARRIEWLDPDTVLSVGKFLGAFSTVSPRRVQTGQHLQAAKPHRFAPVEATEPGLSMQYDTILGAPTPHNQPDLVALTEEEALALAFRRDEDQALADDMSREDRAENDIRRLTSWGMTGMLVFLSGPVAASMAAVNLIKGEDFRLNTQVLALTVFVVTMNSSGAIASVVSRLPI